METKRIAGRYTLTAVERAEKSIELAELIQQLPLKEDYLSQVQKTLKAEIWGMKQAIQSLSRTVRDGWEMRAQECTLSKNYTLRRREWVALETGEILLSEPFTEGDMQRSRSRNGWLRTKGSSNDPHPFHHHLATSGAATGADLRYRSWRKNRIYSGPCWVSDPYKALWFVRREDAERVAAEDEDAWRFAWFACDYPGAEQQLDKVSDLMADFSIEKKRVYVLIGFNGESLAQAGRRLARVYRMGFLPFAMLWRSADNGKLWPRDWRQLQRKWSRPAAYRKSLAGEPNQSLKPTPDTDGAEGESQSGAA